ncbi:MAG: TauD/TfdA family dioxygenase [Bacteroidota bacterium]|jgi:alpha-ketoglutarate-dependent taurine dioxygenase|nr:TauD/TfdA family dioxygenase [Sediminibacterium sp.]
MLKEINFKVSDFKASLSELKTAWSDVSNKVFVLKSDSNPNDVKSFYESVFEFLGNPIPIAEDVNLGNRQSQRSGKIWFEVRYDPKHPDAYRHSSNAQPLHTDGSYIPGFPSSTLLACVANAGEGGETTFIDSKELFRIMEKEKPELLYFLLNNRVKHTRSGDTRIDEIIRIEGEDVFVNYNFYCVDKNNSEEILYAIKEFQDFLLTSSSIQQSTIGVKLAPGDSVFWRDNYCLHGRNSFVANQESERFIWKCAIDILL